MIDTKIRKPKRSAVPVQSAAGKGAAKDPPQRVIRDPAFAKRLIDACDAHPHAPEKHRGRLRWLQEQMSKVGEEVSPETCRKWFAGEARPRPVKMEKLSQILMVDPAWLAMGIDPVLQPRERKARNAMADGVVNVVAGFIQMDGGHPAFPEDDSVVDLHAIIKGANYNFRVALAERDDKTLTFAVPARHDQVVVLAVVRDAGFRVQIYEAPRDVIEQFGENRGGSIQVTCDVTDLRQVTHFRDRL